MEKKKEKRDWRVGAKRTVENFLFQSGVEKTPTETFLMNAIQNESEIMKSVIKVHDKNNDKGDLYENLKLFATWGVMNDHPDLKKWEELFARSGKLTGKNVNNA